MKRLQFYILLVLCFRVAAIKAQIPWEVKFIPDRMLADSNQVFWGAYRACDDPNTTILGKVSKTFPDDYRTWEYCTFDHESMRIKSFYIDMRNFPKGHKDILQMKRRSNREVLYSNDSIALLKFSRRLNYTNTGDYVCQYHFKTKKWSPLIKLVAASDSLFFRPIATDRAGRYFYYTQSYRTTAPPRILSGDLHLICRLDIHNMQADTLLELKMPKRITNLHFQHILLSPDGKSLVLSEHWDKGYKNGDPESHPPQTYIIRTDSPAIQTCLIPSAPYGNFITEDSKYYIVGSFETGKIYKIELSSGKLVQQSKGYAYISEFIPAPSGQYFFVEFVHQYDKRKVLDIRSTKDLGLISSIFKKDLFPDEHHNGTLKAIHGGRTVISKYYARKKEMREVPNILVHQLPEMIDPAKPGSTMANRLKKAELLGQGYQYAQNTELLLTPEKWVKDNLKSVSIGNDGNIIITGKRDIEHLTWGVYIAKISPEGQLLWESKLPHKKISDTSHGMHLPTQDGGCIVYSAYYDGQRSTGQARLSRIDGSGKLVYDYKFDKFTRPNALIPEQQHIQLLPNAAVMLKGSRYISKEKQVEWSGTMSPEGVLTIDD